MAHFGGDGRHRCRIGGMVDTILERGIGLNLCHKGMKLCFGHRTQTMSPPCLARNDDTCCDGAAPVAKQANPRE